MVKFAVPAAINTADKEIFEGVALEETCFVKVDCTSFSLTS